MSPDPAAVAWLNGGTIVEARPVPHPCRTPKPRHMRKNGYAHGTTWRCECGQLWKLTGYVADEFWTRISDDRREAKTCHPTESASGT